jgi:hypothetical protein
MAIEQKHLPGTWRRTTSDRVTQTLKLTVDGEVRLRAEGGPAYLRAVWPLIGDLTGTWTFREPDELIIRGNFEKSPLLKWTGLSFMGKALKWLEDVLEVKPGQSEFDEIWKLGSLTEDKLDDGLSPVYKKL